MLEIAFSIGMQGFYFACFLTSTYCWLVLFYRIWRWAQRRCAGLGIKLG